MLAFACGLMLALIICWNVDVAGLMQSAADIFSGLCGSIPAPAAHKDAAAENRCH